MKKAEFEMNVDWVYDCLASLKSCRDNEVKNELSFLLKAMQNLTTSTLTRKNDFLEARKDS